MFRSSLLSLGSALVLSLATFAPDAEACGGDANKSAQKTEMKTQQNGVQTLSVETLALRMSEKNLKTTPKNMAVVDVNGEQTRKKMGVIPGAILLSSSSRYDVKELPSDKDTSLVFYCSNERCGASKKAASKAMEFGYSDVSVLPAGIAGWVNEGYKTGTPTS
jgi:rhodanese-related sulfurtransferase